MTESCAHCQGRRSWHATFRIIAIALCLFGWWVSLDLLRLSGGAAATNPLINQTCGGPDGEGGSFDCSTVLASAYGSLPLSPQPGGPRLPTAALGLAYFGGLTMWLVFVGAASRKRWYWHGLLIFVLAMACVRSVALTWIMAFELHAWCSGCLTVHIINGLLLVLALLMAPWRSSPEQPPWPSHNLALSTLVGGFALGLFQICIVLLMIFTQMSATMQNKYMAVVTDPNFVRWQLSRERAVGIPTTDTVIWEGDPNAPHEVVLFTDLQCGACRQAHDLMDQLLEQYPGRLRVSYRHFPQDKRCNPAYTTRPHRSACAAALAVEAAHDVGDAAASVALRRLVFAHQAELEATPWTAWGVAVGLDAAAFEQALQDPNLAARVQQDAALGAAVGVKYPPGIFVDGRRMRYWKQQPAVWNELLQDDSRSLPTTAD